MLFISDRCFQMWDFNVSHKQVLIRSPRTPNVATNLDIVFWGVDYLEIATSLDGVELKQGSSNDIVPCFAAKDSKLSEGECFTIISGGNVNFVTAGGCKVLENELDIFESTLVYFNRDRPAEFYGRVLWHSAKSNFGGDQLD